MQTIVTEKKPWTYEFMAHNDVSEDCLYLNVWTAAKNAGEKRPVFVYLYGGGFNEGSAAVPGYDGEGLAKKGLIVVTINYRVGIFGFFTHPELSAESATKTSGNYGLLDQIAALQWVRDNIGAFGGDPARVTIAGAIGRRKFCECANSIAACPGPLRQGDCRKRHRLLSQRRHEEAIRQSRLAPRLLTAKGALNPSPISAPPSQQQLTAPLRGGGRGYRVSVVIDGSFLPQPVTEIYAAGKQSDVPTLTGWNKGEQGGSPNPTITAACISRPRQSNVTAIAPMNS